MIGSSPGILRAIVLPILLLSAAGAYAQEEGNDRPKILTLPEIMARIESSETTYSVEVAPVDSLDEIALDILFPQQAPRHLSPMRVESDGEVEIVPYPYDEYEIGKLTEAEEFFKKKEFERAREIYQELVAERPKCYLAVSHIGDTYYFAGDAESALHYFDAALAINPHDHQPHFFRANALSNLGRFDEAVDSYINTLVLFPRHPYAFDALRRIQNVAGLELHESLFAPRGVAESTDKGVSIKLAEGAMESGWLGYALAKGLWIGEPAHRLEMIGEEEHYWSNVEERECIAALLSGYLVDKEKGKIDPALEKILEVAENGDLEKFMLYEMASRFDPHIAIRRENEVREWMRDYVATYLVVKKGR